MRKFINTALIVLFGMFSFQGNSTSSFAEGFEAYEKKEYSLAAEKFEEVIQQNPNDIAGYYNLGLSKMANKNFGEAIWAFEKVLKFTPNDSEAKVQIERCYGELATSDEWSPRLNGIQSGLYSWSADIWAYVAITFSLFVLFSVFIFKKNKNHSVKRLMFVFGFLSLCFMVASSVIASKVNSYQTESTFAVVTASAIQTFIDEGNPAKMRLSEGQRLFFVRQKSSEFVFVKSILGEEFLVKRTDLSFI